MENVRLVLLLEVVLVLGLVIVRVVLVLVLLDRTAPRAGLMLSG